MNNRILLVFVVAFSASSFGNGFTDRWFWFYEGAKAKEPSYHIKITFNPENRDFCLKTDKNSFIYSNRNNLVQVYQSLDINYAHWNEVFLNSVQLAEGSINIDSLIPFTILPDEPIFSSIVSQASVFSLGNVESQAINNVNYKKVVYTAMNGLSFYIYLEKQANSNYVIRAIFLENGEREYSYRDFDFKRDFDGSGSGAGAGAGVITAQSHALLPITSGEFSSIDGILRIEGQEQLKNKAIGSLTLTFHIYALKYLVK